MINVSNNRNAILNKVTTSVHVLLIKRACWFVAVFWYAPILTIISWWIIARVQNLTSDSFGRPFRSRNVSCDIGVVSRSIGQDEDTLNFSFRKNKWTDRQTQTDRNVQTNRQTYNHAWARDWRARKRKWLVVVPHHCTHRLQAVKNRLGAVHCFRNS